MALILQSCKIWLQSAGFAWHWQSWKFFAGSVWILVMSTFFWNILQWSQARNALTVFHSYPEFRCLIPRCRYQLLSCRRVVWFSGRAWHPAKMLARSGHEDTMWKHTEKTKAFATYFHGENARNGKAGNPSPQGKAARHRNIAVDPCGRCKDLSNIRPICNPLHSALGVRRFRCWFQSRNGQKLRRDNQNLTAIDRSAVSVFNVNLRMFKGFSGAISKHNSFTNPDRSHLYSWPSLHMIGGNGVFLWFLCVSKSCSFPFCHDFHSKSTEIHFWHPVINNDFHSCLPKLRSKLYAFGCIETLPVVSWTVCKDEGQERNHLHINASSHQWQKPWQNQLYTTSQQPSLGQPQPCSQNHFRWCYPQVLTWQRLWALETLAPTNKKEHCLNHFLLGHGPVSSQIGPHSQRLMEAIAKKQCDNDLECPVIPGDI